MERGTAPNFQLRGAGAVHPNGRNRVHAGETARSDRIYAGASEARSDPVCKSLYWDLDGRDANVATRFRSDAGIVVSRCAVLQFFFGDWDGSGNRGSMETAERVSISHRGISSGFSVGLLPDACRPSLSPSG